MENKEVRTYNTGGFSFLGVLTIVFITLKLTGNIGWSWVWVLAPLWIPWSIVLLFVLLAGLFVLVATAEKSWKK